jgi:hypothetical protein
MRGFLNLIQQKSNEHNNHEIIDITKRCYL